MAEGTSSESGTGGAGNRAARFPVMVTRSPRLPRSANDNQPPRWLRIARLAFLLALAGLLVVWARM